MKSPIKVYDFAVTRGRPPRGGRGLKCKTLDKITSLIKSPPSRGAWIEISNRAYSAVNPNVAPLAGGVD